MCKERLDAQTPSCPRPSWTLTQELSALADLCCFEGSCSSTVWETAGTRAALNFLHPWLSSGKLEQSRGQIRRRSHPSCLNPALTLRFSAKHLRNKENDPGETHAQCCNSIKIFSLKALLPFADAPHIIIWHML